MNRYKRGKTRGYTSTMKRMNLYAAAFFTMLVIVSASFIGATYANAAVGGWDSNDLPTGNMRQVPLDIKIVFVGINQACVNTSDYFPWLLPPYHIQRETWYGTNWGVNFTFNYSYKFNQTFDMLFFAYLHSIRNDVIRANPYNGVNQQYRFYNANKAEEWLYSNPSGYGGIPATGYVLFLINLTKPDYPNNLRQHYYNLTYSDVDSTGIVTGDWYGQWMSGWGGHHRLYYIDVSAGVSAASVGAWNPPQRWWNHYFPPLWSLNINLGTRDGINFLNKYLSDFVFGAVYDCFSEDFIYPPRIAPMPNLRYNMTIIIFDNCTSYWAQTLEGGLPPYGLDFAITQPAILKAFQNLAPYATWTVNLTYAHIGGPGSDPYGTLWKVVRSAERTADAFGNPVSYVDRDILYHHLQAHLADFGLVQLAGQLLIPVFVFAFKGTFNLGYQYEGYEYDDYWGFGYPDVVLVSHSLYDLTGVPPPPPPPLLPKVPQGFTQTIIHEVGHSIGLIHPFWWDYDEDFVASAMAYYPYEYMFSQFDADAIQRGHTDYYLTRAVSMMENATELKQWRQMNSTLLTWYGQALSNLTSAGTSYNGMNYHSAMDYATTALDLFTKFVEGANQQPQTQQPPVTEPVADITTVLVAAVAGFAVGIILGLLIAKKKRRK